jgi:hypothetical protein
MTEPLVFPASPSRARGLDRLCRQQHARPGPRLLRPASKKVRFLANRGAGSIDGVISTALGVAATSDKPTVLVSATSPSATT